MGWMNDETGLDKCAANHVPLTPLSHLARAAKVFPQREAMVYGNMRQTYAQYHARVSQLASALQIAGVGPGDVVATLLPNVPAQAEAHFGVPAAGAVLNTINIRLDVDTIAYIFDHGEAKVVLCDSQFLPVCMQAIEQMQGAAPLVVEVPDPQAGVPEIAEQIDYETFLQAGDPSFAWGLSQRCMNPQNQIGISLKSVDGTFAPRCRPRLEKLKLPSHVFTIQAIAQEMEVADNLAHRVSSLLAVDDTGVLHSCLMMAEEVLILREDDTVLRQGKCDVFRVQRGN